MTHFANDMAYDADLLLMDSQAQDSGGGASEVDSVAKQIDLGDACVRGRTILDVTAITVSSNDEQYIAQMQFSNTSGFGSGVVVGPAYVLGAHEVAGGSADTPTGRYEWSWTNEIGGTRYRYARLFWITTGTSETITASAFAALQ